MSPAPCGHNADLLMADDYWFALRNACPRSWIQVWAIWSLSDFNQRFENFS